MKGLDDIAYFALEVAQNVEHGSHIQLVVAVVDSHDALDVVGRERIPPQKQRFHDAVIAVEFLALVVKSWRDEDHHFFSRETTF